MRSALSKSWDTVRSLDWLYDPKTRGLIFQVALVVALIVLGYEIVTNTAENLRKQNLASGFGFLGKTASFDISQTLIEYRSTMSYGRAFLVGLLNTLLVSGLGIVLATLLGFAIGLGRLSPNWIVARLSTVYVETVRNVPLLLQLFVWYVGVLRTMPMPQQALALGPAHVDVRGLHLPRFVLHGEVGWILVVALAVRHRVGRGARASGRAAASSRPGRRSPLLRPGSA